jgi:hypothetical protein
VGFTGDGLVCSPIPAPHITSFSTSYAQVCAAGVAALRPVFENGSGDIEPGLGVVTTGSSVSTGALSASTTFTLTVTNAAGVTASQAVTVTTLQHGVFTRTGDLPEQRGYNAAALLQSGRVLVLGGHGKVYRNGVHEHCTRIQHRDIDAQWRSIGGWLLRHNAAEHRALLSIAKRRAHGQASLHNVALGSSLVSGTVSAARTALATAD